MKESKLILVALSLVIGIWFTPHHAFGLDKIRISIAQLPIAAESKEKGVYIDLLKAVSRVTGVSINIQVVPFARSLQYVIDGRVDAHIPLIRSLYHKTPPPYDLSSVALHSVNFVLYTNKDKPLNMGNLQACIIETDTAHVNYFNFDILPSSCIECSLKKVNAGRIDGFIFADSVTDGLVRKNALPHIRRQLYRVYDAMIILPKGRGGGEVDQFLFKAVEKLKSTGEYQKIMGPLDIPYDPWQP